MVLGQRATQGGVVRVGVGWRLVCVGDIDMTPSEDLPVCRFERDSRVLQKRKDKSVSSAIVNRIIGAIAPGDRLESEQSRSRRESAAGA